MTVNPQAPPEELYIDFLKEERILDDRAMGRVNEAMRLLMMAPSTESGSVGVQPVFVERLIKTGYGLFPENEKNTVPVLKQNGRQMIEAFVLGLSRVSHSLAEQTRGLYSSAYSASDKSQQKKLKR